jgi:hypothetical protein
MKDPLSITHPQLATQWHPTKNGELTPAQVVAGSNKKAWWICFHGSDHEWKAVIGSRARLGVGCPFCAGLKPSITNSLASLYPEIAAQWHPTKNGSLTPDQVVAGSNKKAWWICPKGSDHEWEAQIGARANGRGCHFCTRQKPSLTNSLVSLHPEIAKEWHPTKNETLTPDKVIAGSHKKAWWKCSNGLDHEWEAVIKSRTNGCGCPFCAGQKPSVTNSLASLYPQLAKEWHPTNNGTLTPDQVVAGSERKAWWKCSKGSDHEWDASIRHRTVDGSGCPFCAGKKPSVTNSLASLYPEIAQQWHPMKNGELTPDQVVAGSNKKAWWICSNNPEHEWEAMIGNRAKGVGCPYCANQKPSATNSLANLYPEISKQWHPAKNRTLTPDQVVAGSNKKAWWICPKGSDHEWEAKIGDRVKGNGCPFCRSLRPSITNSLAKLYPEIAKQWHPTKNGTLTPNQVVAGSEKKAWWICFKGTDHVWEATIYSRINGTGCPFCAGKRPSISNSLANLYPEIAAQWHPTKNGTLTPDQVTTGSAKKVWWLCRIDPSHE